LAQSFKVLAKVVELDKIAVGSDLVCKLPPVVRIFRVIIFENVIVESLAKIAAISNLIRLVTPVSSWVEVVLIFLFKLQSGPEEELRGPVLRSSKHNAIINVLPVATGKLIGFVSPEGVAV
jgi:hypothetical protein